ncbi:unnamed protein product [Penicillium nalgiovense]|nr:unnamed protein product [Penicillium nalgiovense]
MHLFHATGDGRSDIHIDERRPSSAGLLDHLLYTYPQPEAGQADGTDATPKHDGGYFPLRLNIVIQVIGSRGDIQPFLALGKELKAHGHRVRLATHLAFRDFIEDGRLEFFDIGGDPAELMTFMVKNPGLLPNVRTIRSGAIRKRRREMRQIVNGCWRSCHEMGDGTHMHQTKEVLFSDIEDYRRRPFAADAIIANPPCLAHIHCAQRLGIPLHIMFTMPWSPTQSFPHPLAIIHHQDSEPTVTNYISYAIVDIMVWEGLGDIVNTFRKRALALDPLDAITARNLIHRLRVPCSYLWSPAILPKPKDWGDNIDICGFSFLPSKPDYTTPERMDAFLKAGSTPVYVGFGSIVVDDQVKLTKIVFETISKAGQRAIISKGCGNLGVDEVDVPDNILIIESCPHDWLFRKVSCVIHHGGAGTTAAGLALGRPTIIIPFFGDQQFWGDIVSREGAGPAPIPHKQLTVENLSSALGLALSESTKNRAQQVAKMMEKESGVRDGVCSFYRQLNLRRLRCAICQTRPAVWHVKHTKIALSAFAASVLVEIGRVKPEELVLYRPMEYNTYRDPVEPLSAGAQVLLGAIAKFVTGLVDVPAEVAELVSAGRALGHPHPHVDPLSKWHKRRSHHEETLESDEGDEKDEEIGCRLGNHNGPYRTSSRQLGSDQGAEEQELSDGTDHRPTRQKEDNDGSEPHPDGSFPEGSVDRTCSLQLEMSQSMSEITPSESHNIFSELVSHGGKMSRKLANLIIWLPTDLSLSLSKGFHNAPKLYHDPMVHPAPKVIGVRSGFKAAGDEFRDGFYDGVTGLVSQPRYGYKQKGIKGMLKGVGKGLGGVFFKPSAGLWGLAGYPLAGIRCNLLGSLSKSVEGRIVVSRIAEGQEQMQASTAAERGEVMRKWMLIEESLQRTGRQCRYAHPAGRHTDGHVV